jgi:predicted transcriptional regulator
MADKKAAPGRKAPEGAKKQFLTSMDPEIIRRIKAAAALRDRTASVILEEAAKDWLERNENSKGQGKRG